MSPDFEHYLRENVLINVGNDKVELKLYPDEVYLTSRIENSLNAVRNGSGIAFFLPSLPSDHDYNSLKNKDCQWFSHSYVFIVAKFDGKLNTLQIPCPIIMHESDDQDSFLERLDEMLKAGIKVIPATLFAKIMGWFPEENDSHKKNLNDHIIKDAPLNHEMITKVSSLGLGSYAFLDRVGMRVSNFLELLTNYDDLSIDHFMFRMLKEGTYRELIPFSIYRPKFQAKLPGFSF